MFVLSQIVDRAYSVNSSDTRAEGHLPAPAGTDTGYMAGLGLEVGMLTLYDVGPKTPENLPEIMPSW